MGTNAVDTTPFAGVTKTVKPMVIPARKPTATSPFPTAPYRTGYWADKVQEFGDTLNKDLHISVNPQAAHDSVETAQKVDAIRAADPANAGYTIYADNAFQMMGEGIRQSLGNLSDSIKNALSTAKNNAVDSIGNKVSGKAAVWIWVVVAVVLVASAFAILARRASK